MKTIKYSLFGFVSAILLSGCVPEQRIIWSPDGQQAMVLGRENNQQTLYLCDTNGSLSSKLFDNVHRAAWRPDSRGLILSRSQSMNNWPELESLLAEAEKNGIIKAAAAFLEGYAQTGTLEHLEELIEAENYRNAVKLYLRHHHAELFDKDAAKEGKKHSSTHAFIIQTATVRGNTIEPGKIIAGSTMPVWEMRVSPQNLAVAYTCGEIEDGTSPPPSLYIASLDDESPPKQIARNVSLFPDWSPDGQHIIYAVGNNHKYGKELQLGAITRCNVADENGQLRSGIPEREDLVGVIMNHLIRVRCTADGTIVFSALEINLPATANDMPEYMTLFKIDPSELPIVSRIIPRDVEYYFSSSSTFYELSPEGEYIAFLGRDDHTTAVAALHLATGEIRHSDSTTDKNLPSWRSAKELCYIRTSKDGKNPEVVLINQHGPRIISKKWPSELLESMGD